MAHIHKLIDFTVGALIVHDGRVCLVHHKKLGYWVPPGGHIELHENPDQALFREIEEETGFTKDDLEILAELPTFPADTATPLYRPQWMTIHPFDDTHRHIVFEYVLRANSDKLRLADMEHHDIRWFSRTELEDPKVNIPNEVRWYAKEAIKIAS